MPTEMQLEQRRYWQKLGTIRRLQVGITELRRQGLMTSEAHYAVQNILAEASRINKDRYEAARVAYYEANKHIKPRKRKHSNASF